METFTTRVKYSQGGFSASHRFSVRTLGSMICCAVVAGPKMFQPFSHGLIKTFKRREILKIPMANNLLGIDGFSMCIKAGPTAVIRNIKTLQFDNIFCALGIFVFVGCFQKKSQCVKWAFCSVDFKVCVECAALCGFL